eukprot:2594549-Rhodomonas_salina.1
METAFLVESAQPTVRRGSRAPSFWTWGASLSAVLLVTIVCLLLVRDDRGFATLNASHAVIRASLLEVLSPSKTTKLQDFEATFAQYKNLSHEERAQITQGYMVCCIRDDSDIPPPVYGPAADYYEDWPIDPICIPGYVKVGEECEECPRNTYCPAKVDLVKQCPPPLASRLATRDVKGCWCPPGTEGSQSDVTNLKPVCNTCPVDTYCPGENFHSHT